MSWIEFVSGAAASRPTIKLMFTLLNPCATGGYIAQTFGYLVRLWNSFQNTVLRRSYRTAVPGPSSAVQMVKDSRCRPRTRRRSLLGADYAAYDGYSVVGRTYTSL